MVLAPKNGNITIGNEVNLEYHDHSYYSTSAQRCVLPVSFPPGGFINAIVKGDPKQMLLLND